MLNEIIWWVKVVEKYGKMAISGKQWYMKYIIIRKLYLNDQ